MKKLSIAGILLLFVLPSMNCKKQDTIAPREGLVNFTIGDVKLVSPAGSQLAKVGDAVKEGMKIVTKGDKSQADVFFGENAIKILGNTTVEVKALVANLTQNTEKTELFVNNGGVFSSVKKLAKNDDYVVKSPTTTAGVRGTEFLVEEQGGKANISCIDGKVECVNNTKTDDPAVIIEKNEEVVIQPGQNMVKQQIDSDRMRMLNIIRNIQEMRDDIRQQYMKQREEMRKYYEEQKQKFKDDVQKQRDEDRARVDNQRAQDKANVDAARGSAEQAAKDTVTETQSQMSAAKDGARKEQATGGVQDQINQMKQMNKDQVAPQ